MPVGYVKILRDLIAKQKTPTVNYNGHDTLQNLFFM